MTNNNLPMDFQHPGGFVEDVMNFINDTAVCPQPMFALAAALSAAGTLYGRRVQSEDGQRTNIFCMTVGYTSCGKDHALKCLDRIFDESEASYLRLGQVTSDSAIEWALKRQSRLCFCIDEAGHYFSGVSDAKTAAGPAHMIKPALLELWSSAGSRWIGKQRVPKDGKELPPLVVDNPHLNLYATTQPQILFESMTRSDLRDGWLARNLFFISKTRPKPAFKKVTPVPNRIRAVVFAWKGQAGEQGRCQELVTVPTTSEAQSVFTAFNDQIYAKMLAADSSGDECNYLYGKALENARRIALILAVSKTGEGGEAVIGTDEAVYATKLVDYLIRDVIAIVEESMSETEVEKVKKRILALIVKSGYEGVLKGDITRHTQYVRRALRDEYLEDLLESAEVQALPAKSGGFRYYAAGLTIQK